MVIIKDLNVKDEDFIFDGDVRLLGKIYIENGSLIVNGHVTLEDLGSIFIKGGNLTAKSIANDGTYDYSSFYVEDGDVHITEGNFKVGCHIEVLGDVFVENGNLIAAATSAFNVYVNGDIDVGCIKTIEDIFFVHGDTGNVNCGRDLYIKDSCCFHFSDVYVNGNFICERKVEQIKHLHVNKQFICNGGIPYIF